MDRFNKKKIYIVLFAILYICVGLVSTIHAVSFFALANVMALAVILALAFEVGQAAVLFSILTDIKKRKQVMPWVLMSVLTIVQVLGNIFSSYKYLIVNSEDKLRYFKEPIFVWVENMPDQNANVILVYIIGAILPIVSLLMTAMLTSYLDNNEQQEETTEESEEETIEDNQDFEEIQEEQPEPETITEQIQPESENQNNNLESHIINL
jgi:MFS family permease